MAFFKTTRDQLKTNAFISNLEFAKTLFRPNDFSRAGLHVQWAFQAVQKIKKAKAGYILAREGWLYAAGICHDLATAFSQAKANRLSGICWFMHTWALWNEDQIGEGGVSSKVRSVISPGISRQSIREPEYHEEPEPAVIDTETRIQMALDSQAVTFGLSGSEHTSVPDSIGKLAKLQTLSITATLLTSLPETLGELTALQELYIYNNRLTTLPASIGNLINLKKISAGVNRLESLPESIGNLISLEELYLDDNRLTYLPKTLGDLPNLHSIDVSGNLLTGPVESFGSLGQLIEDQLNDQWESL
jgi:hypothetical protein